MPTYHWDLLFPRHPPEGIRCALHRPLRGDPREIASPIPNVVRVDVVGRWVVLEYLIMNTVGTGQTSGT
jgi:hypothetical protein